MFTPERAIFVLVDVQGRLAELMHNRDALMDSLGRLIEGMRALDIPIIWMEQVPEKMGPTVPELAARLDGLRPLAKTSFGCCGDAAFMAALERSGRDDIVVAGIEAHVCMTQTVEALRVNGYRVEVVADATSSRTAANRQIGLDRMARAGAGISSVETILFELMGSSEHPAFREVQRCLK